MVTLLAAFLVVLGLASGLASVYAWSLGKAAGERAAQARHASWRALYDEDMPCP
jgi:hypothetical protein